MTLAGRWACSRLQIELVIVESMRIAESSKEPSTNTLQISRCEEAVGLADMKLLIYVVASHRIVVDECLRIEKVRFCASSDFLLPKRASETR
jgi:hypothetical protein